MSFEFIKKLTTPDEIRAKYPGYKVIVVADIDITD